MPHTLMYARESQNTRLETPSIDCLVKLLGSGVSDEAVSKAPTLVLLANSDPTSQDRFTYVARTYT